MLFATFILDREPMSWAELPRAATSWLQSAGGIAALGLLLAWLANGCRFDRLFAGTAGRASPGLTRLGAFAVVASWAAIGLVLATFVGAWLGIRSVEALLPSGDPNGTTIGDLALAAAGGLALAVVAFPVLRSLVAETRFVRIGAIARLCLKEAIRNRGAFVFGVMAVVFLFADWFIPYKPEDQIRNYVSVLYWTMFPLFILSAGVLGSFGLPNDIRNQTIHTVVTKPIGKFEVVLGRFVGYGILLTAALAAIGLVSLGYIWRGLTEQARAESFLARVPVYGDLGFVNTKGDSVGREWDYRKYISGSAAAAPGKRQYAVWQFADLSEVQPRADGAVRFEFDFDIFRLTKGEENKGVFCTFKFADGRLGLADIERAAESRRQEKDKRLNEARKAAGGAPVDFAGLNAKIDADLLREFPVVERSGVEVTDYHTQSIDVPFALFERLREARRDRPAGAAGREPPALVVLVSIDSDRASAAQMLGVARRDLYILADERGFYANFLKGLVGLWFLTLLVLGVAICCSTYLSGVVSFLCTMFLTLAGFFLPSLQQLANNQSVGGGPFEAFSRIVTRNNLVTPLEDSPSTAVILATDEAFRWWLRRILTLIPDVSRYDLHHYVANGFDISPTRVLFVDDFVPLVGYLVPWFVLAFYLINYREIANPM